MSLRLGNTVFNILHYDWFQLIPSCRAVFKTGNNFLGFLISPMGSLDMGIFFARFEPTFTKKLIECVRKLFSICNRIAIRLKF